MSDLEKGMRRIRLTSNQLDFLEKAEFLPTQIRMELAQAMDARVSSDLLVRDSLAIELGNRLTIRLAEIGFDPDYSPTDEGNELEDLIDAIGFRCS